MLFEEYSWRLLLFLGMTSCVEEPFGLEIWDLPLSLNEDRLLANEFMKVEKEQRAQWLLGISLMKKDMISRRESLPFKLEGLKLSLQMTNGLQVKNPLQHDASYTNFPHRLQRGGEAKARGAPDSTPG